MKRIYWILTGIMVLTCLGQPGNAIILYDDGGIHEISTDVTEDIDIFDGPLGTPTTLKLLEGAMTEDIGIFDHSILLLSGGTIDDGSLTMHDYSRGEISGGSMTDDTANLYGHSQLTITGGSFSVGILLHSDSQLFIYGSDFKLDQIPVDYGPIQTSFGILTGNLPNGPLELDFHRLDNATVTLIPEPTSLSLLLLGMGLVRRKRNR
jgi:PEP-CTERM motif-containing protein